MKTRIATILFLLTAPFSAVIADTTANFGWVSEYIFRGISQDDSSAFVGLDYENSGFYIGTWAADVGQGAEVDLYLGYGGDIGDNLSYALGVTGYFYTDDFDDTYTELNYSISNDYFSFDGAIGQYKNFAGPTLDYTFHTLKGEYNDAYLLVGSFGQDFDGEYIEAGYGLNISGFAISISLVHGTSSLLGTTDNSIVFGISKSLALE